MSDNYKEKIYEIAVDTFEVACYMFPLEEWEIEDEQEISLTGRKVRALVAFEGTVEGKMIIMPSKTLLTAMAQNMLGISNPTEEHKSGALCEVANIICGNVVPLLGNSDNICSIQPPQMITAERELPHTTPEMNEESIQLYLDEGTVELAFYYQEQEEN